MSESTEVEVREAPATIKDAERVAKEHASRAIEEAREHAKSMVQALRPIAASPLFGNGLHKGLTDAVKVADKLDDELQNIQKALHEHFNGGDEA